MFANLYKHLPYYIVLIVILFLGFLLIYNSPNRIFQIGTYVAITFFYILWGIIHHLINHNLNSKIVIEYVFIGSFGLVVMFFLLSVNGNY
jgi:hypothetical protein